MNLVKNWIIGVLLFGSLLVLSACETVYVDYSSFSNLKATDARVNYYIQPNEGQVGSIEFNQYVGSIERLLLDKGWYRVVQTSKARYIVFLDYGMVENSTPLIDPKPYEGFFHINVVKRESDVSVFELKSTSRSVHSTFAPVAECVFDVALENFPVQLAMSDLVEAHKCGK